METQPLDTENLCRHHWLLGAPSAGVIEGRCKKCGASRTYPAVLEGYEPGVEDSDHRVGNQLLVVTAGGGARPSRLED
jgi:hypothetical protein